MKVMSHPCYESGFLVVWVPTNRGTRAAMMAHLN
jgi:hypothetical protein